MATTARSQEFADAALRIVAREGLAGVSFRTVAAEAGWSLGAVQKAFRTKDELVAAAFERAQQRVSAGASESPAKPTLAIWLIRLVLATLPLDEERRAAVVVGAAFAEHAAVDPRVGTAVSAADAAVRADLVRLFSWRRSEGELTSPLGDDELARAVLAFAAGLASQLLYDPRPADTVEAHVSAVLRTLLGGDAGSADRSGRLE